MSFPETKRYTPKRPMSRWSYAKLPLSRFLFNVTGRLWCIS
jgi:hypothetical protein